MKRKEIFEKFQELSLRLKDFGCIAQNDWAEFPIEADQIKEWSETLAKFKKDLENLEGETFDAIQEYIK